MTSATGTPNSVESTTALLQAELPRLEEHQQSLEKELAAVTERLESVRNALSALQALSLAPGVRDQGAAAPDAPAVAGVESAPPAASPKKDAPAEEAPAAGAAPKKSAPKKRTPAKKTANPKRAKLDGAQGEAGKAAGAKKAQPAAASADDSAGGLTEQVLEVLAGAAGGSVRARDVAQVLGRDDSPGSINAVRSTLDRLVATSRADRAGRGLYQARN
jgi:hypothetical protein